MFNPPFPWPRETRRFAPSRHQAKPSPAHPRSHPVWLLKTGDLEYGIWTAGQVQGLINDVPTSCAELIERMVRECEATILQRLVGMIHK